MVRVVLLHKLHFQFYTYFIVPTPNVSISVHNDTKVDQPLSLICSITTVRGINSQVNITWIRGNDGEERTRENVNPSITMFSSVMYRDYFNISQLTTDENGETYTCEVMINANPPVMASDSYTLNVIGKNCNYIRTLTSCAICIMCSSSIFCLYLTH